MESIELFGLVMQPHTWPLLLGVPGFLIISGILGCLYEYLSNHKNGESQ